MGLVLVAFFFSKVLNKKEIWTSGKERLNVRLNLGYLDKVVEVEFGWFHIPLPLV